MFRMKLILLLETQQPHQFCFRIALHEDGREIEKHDDEIRSARRDAPQRRSNTHAKLRILNRERVFGGFVRRSKLTSDSL